MSKIRIIRSQGIDYGITDEETSETVSRIACEYSQTVLFSPYCENHRLTMGMTTVRTIPGKSGQRISRNRICFYGTDGKIHHIGTTNVPVNLQQTPFKFISSSTILQNTEIQITQAGYVCGGIITIVTQQPQQCKPIYLKFTYPTDGNVFSTNKATYVMQNGYTYMPIATYAGVSQDGTKVYNFNSIGKHYYSINSEGKLTHIDGIPIA